MNSKKFLGVDSATAVLEDEDEVVIGTTRRYQPPTPQAEDPGGPLFVNESSVGQLSFLFCNSCGKVLTTTPVVTSFGELCPECAATKTFQCSHCGLVIPVEQKQVSDSGEAYCTRCFIKLFKRCYDCGRYERIVCSYNISSINEPAMFVCSACWEAHFRICQHPRCGRIFRIADADGVPIESIETHQFNGVWFCDLHYETARSEYEASQYRIMPWGYAPALYFHGCCEKLGSATIQQDGHIYFPAIPYFGVELEFLNKDLESRPELARNLLSRFSKKNRLFFLKPDGSLENEDGDNTGIELVTHPCTLAYHQHAFPWEDILSFLRESECTSHDTQCCGLHIHVSRSAFTAEAFKRFDYFINTHKSEMEILARRKESRWSKFKPLDSVRSGGANYANRYEAVNFLNRNTVEVRMFRGTLIHTSLLGTIEFVDSMLQFVRNSRGLKLNEHEACWNNYKIFVSRHKDRYSHFIEYARNRFERAKGSIDPDLINDSPLSGPRVRTTRRGAAGRIR